MSTKPTRRTQAERSDRTREAVLAAAVRVIATRGYAEATIQQIADAAEISKGAVQYHYRAKHELIAPVLERCAQSLRDSARIAWSREAAPADRLRGTLRALWDARREGGPEVLALLDLLTRGVRDPAVREAVNALLDAAARDLEAELASSLGALGLRPRVPLASVPRVLFALLDGLTLHRALSPEHDAEVPPALEALAFSLFTL